MKLAQKKNNQSQLIDKILNLKRPNLNLELFVRFFNKNFKILGESRRIVYSLSKNFVSIAAGK